MNTMKATHCLKTSTRIRLKMVGNTLSLDPCAYVNTSGFPLKAVSYSDSLVFKITFQVHCNSSLIGAPLQSK